MPTTPLRKIIDAADAAHCLEALAQSGSSLWVWAQANSVNPRSLSVWKDRLRTAVAQTPAPAPRLVELVAAPVQRPTYRLRVDEVQIELDSNFEEATLTRLLRAVRAC
jgi:hypothetical protein